MALDRGRYQRRRIRSRITVWLCWAAAGLGLAILGIILATLLYKGFAGLGINVFTEMTPPPGSDGGLLNAIVGSLIGSMVSQGISTGRIDPIQASMEAARAGILYYAGSGGAEDAGSEGGGESGEGGEKGEPTKSSSSEQPSTEAGDGDSDGD